MADPYAPYATPVAAPKPTVKERGAEADITQSGASAASSAASARKSGEETVTEVQTRPAKVRKAMSDAELAELKAKQAQLAWEKTQQMLSGIPKPAELPAAQDILLKEVRNLSQAIKLSRDMFGASGIGHDLTSGYSGLPATDVEALLKPILASEAFGQLSKMRASSPTGGALGNVTEKELDLLKYAEGAADPSASDEVFQQGAKDLLEKRLRVLGKLGADPYTVAQAIGPDLIGDFADKVESYRFLPQDEKALQNYVKTSKADGSYDPSTMAALMGQAYYNATGRAPDEAYVQGATGEAQRLEQEKGAPSFDYGKAWEQQRQQLVPYVTGQQREGLGWGETLGGAGLNLIPSTFQFAADTVKALTLNLPDTLEGVASVVGGATGLSDPDAYEAIKQYYANRYGTWEGFKEALRTDPASIVADVAGIVSLGGTLAAKAANVAGKIGVIAEAANGAKNFAMKIDPAMLALKAGELGIKAGKKVGEEMTIGIPSRVAGVTSTETKQAIQAGREGSKPFLEQMYGTGEVTDPIEKANSAIGELYQERSKAYRANMDRLKGDEAVTYDDIDAALSEARDIGQHKGVDISAASGVWNDVYDKVAEFRNAGLSTLEDFDKLKQAIRNIGSKYGIGSPEYKVAKDVAKAVNTTIEAKAPQYAKFMKDYRIASDTLADVQSTLSTGAASKDTVLNKLRKVASGKGPRGTTVLQLLEGTKSGKGLGNMLAGQAMAGTETRGFTSAAAPVAAMMGSPEALGALLVSPRMLGEAGYNIGRGLSKLDETKAALADRYGLDTVSQRVSDLARKYGPAAGQTLRVVNPALIQPMTEPAQPAMADISMPVRRRTPLPGMFAASDIDLGQFRSPAAAAPQGLDLSRYQAPPARPTAIDPATGLEVYTDTGEPVEGQ